MPTYSTFDHILNADTVDTNERLRFAKRWLSKTYRIINVNQEWLNILTEPHNHDNLPKHFGQVKISTAFVSLITQLVKIQNVWHIGIIKKNDSDGIIIHPTAEESGKTTQNEKNRLLLMSIARNGTVNKNMPILQGTELSPVATLSPDEIYTAKDSSDNVKEDVSSYKLDLSAPNKTRSVDIDLSEYF